jgi:hypothetical protein
VKTGVDRFTGLGHPEPPGGSFFMKCERIKIDIIRIRSSLCRSFAQKIIYSDEEKELDVHVSGVSC